MKNLIIFIFALTLTSCSVNAQQSADAQNLTLTGSTLPAIRHINDMKITGDTLWFVYETEGGYGQRFLRRAIIDCKNHTLGRKGDGSYMSYMPYPVMGYDSNMRVVNQDDGEVYCVEDDSQLVSTKNYIFNDNSTIPFPLSQYVQDIFMKGPNQYLFIGREPKGGRQYAMTADLTSTRIDTIRQISISPELQTWMPNMGELVYSCKYNRLAFAYLLHPIIEIFDMEGKLIKSVRIGEDTFNPKTLEEADFEDLNILHTVDVTYTADYIYALHWSYRYANATVTSPTIYKIDWNGNIINRLFQIPTPFYRIAVGTDGRIIGWNGHDFLRLSDLLEN
ncbi:MAG: hypothetical protein NC212_09795 [Staphylococcus sp.]|nr:hypothetical protein [Staphylococcus sp.]